MMGQSKNRHSNLQRDRFLIAESIELSFNGRPILTDLEAQFHAGTSTAIVGPNGSGKSSFLNILAGKLKPNRGRVVYRNINPKNDIGLLNMQRQLNLDVPLSTRDLVQMAFYRRRGSFTSASEQDLADFHEIVDILMLNDCIDQTIDTLSAGQRQRALLARLHLANFPVLLLDEPFNTLDAASTQILLKLIDTWQSQGKIILVVSHQGSHIVESFSQTLFISRQYVAQGPTRFVLGNAPSELGDAP